MSQRFEQLVLHCRLGIECNWAWPSRLRIFEAVRGGPAIILITKLHVSLLVMCMGGSSKIGSGQDYMMLYAF